MHIDPKDIKEFTKALQRGVQIFGEAVFDKSQRYVPVESGILKQSGYFTPMKDGIDIRYAAPYASAREHIVPKVSRQRWPRGTHYIERAEKEELVSLAWHIAAGIRMSALSRLRGQWKIT